MTTKAIDSSQLFEEGLEEQIRQKIDTIAAVADELPGVLLIHNLRKQLAVEYMSPRGLQHLGVSLEQLREMGTEYHNTYFNPEDAKDYVPKVTAFIEENNDGIVSFFQQVRARKGDPWSWHFSTTKIFMRDGAGAPLLTITMAYPIDPLHHVTTKVARLLDENNFLRKNFHRFSKLSGREQEVLQLMALGQSASETAEELCISVTTVETHRRNIKKKLDTNSFFELTQYARAFNLI
ncbi:hypothetical protein GCM10023188_03490 [Pontibacter saemangeumensis]|uniref:HTH luxR-type domain-containing protein n=1 Tax=Pontibacter saemangeumensis TaxID=1084525 RepID=A0ABP8L874_9BACT